MITRVMRRIFLVLTFLLPLTAPAVTTQTAMPATMVKQATLAYDAGSVRVVSGNVLTGSEAYRQDGSPFAPIAGLDAAKNVANPVPSTMARVVDASLVNRPTLGFSGANDVFVTAASDIRGITTSQGLANRLTLLDNAGNLRQGPFGVIEFNTPASGVASPVFRNNPGFIQGGMTGGGAREFVLPNMPISQLQNVTTRIVP